MKQGLPRVGVVGSSSLLGKELIEELADSVLGVVDVILLDDDVEVGQVTAAGEEATFVQRIEAGSFDGMDFCFFAGKLEDTRRHWGAAVRAGVKVVDLTGALLGEEEVALLAPWVVEAQRARGEYRPDRGTRAIVPAHPVAVMLGLVASRCAGLRLEEMAATVLEPASERGTAGLDEMHQQTVKLLSFQSVPREEYDAQVAFNLLSDLGAGARVTMQGTANRIREDYLAIQSKVQVPMMLQLIHAPVFHGYGVSLLLEFKEASAASEVANRLAGGYIEVTVGGEEAPSNVSAAGQRKILVKVGPGEGRRLWLWMAADNLKIRALLGLASAKEMLGLQSVGAAN